ncbi:MAG: hypothetical protein LBF04_05215, partial [Prevotellaceae bacterium]|nr:hypothetical protein [Prevotellaceae bacterium]
YFISIQYLHYRRKVITLFYNNANFFTKNLCRRHLTKHLSLLCFYRQMRNEMEFGVISSGIRQN